MITNLKIANFKSHSNTNLDLKNLTVLSGLNGSGKSSVLQSLLLLRQAFQKRVLEKGLDLNKPFCDIGTANDAIYQYAGSDIISFSIDVFMEGKVETFDWRFEPDRNALNKSFIPIHKQHNARSVNSDISLFGNEFQYLSASRLGPKDSYTLNTLEVEINRQLSIEKGQGELAVHFLYYYGREKKEPIKFEALKNLFSTESDLLSQTSAWEREISPNVNVIPVPFGKSFELKYSFNKPNDIIPTNEFSAENVGFGISYVLPIILALLSAEKGSLILIENPEAHIHPSGQSKLAELIALAANEGVQIILETHSDHIINGILLQSKRFELEGKGIDKSNLKIYHFNRSEEEHSSLVAEVVVESGGRIQNRPEDFFDQFGKDIRKLL